MTDSFTWFKQGLRGVKPKDMPFSHISGKHIYARAFGHDVWYDGVEFDVNGQVIKTWVSLPNNWSVASSGTARRVPYLGHLEASHLPCVFIVERGKVTNILFTKKVLAKEKEEK